MERVGATLAVAQQRSFANSPQPTANTYQVPPDVVLRAANQNIMIAGGDHSIIYRKGRPYAKGVRRSRMRTHFASVFSFLAQQSAVWYTLGRKVVKQK